MLLKNARWISAFAGMTLLLWNLPAKAEDFVYAPEDCEFQITFPGEPYTTERCHPDLPEKCDFITSYTKVTDLSSTMNFYVSCKKTEGDLFATYDKESMRTTVIGMAGRTKLETFETSFEEEEDMRRASILGAGPSYNGQNVLLYMGQLLVGKSSVMTIEAELVGEANEETDKQFAGIIRSAMTKKTAKLVEEAKKSAPAETPQEENTEKPEPEAEKTQEAPTP